jgi:4a-hydroxytetrahydrobiopterin dehydratase
LAGIEQATPGRSDGREEYVAILEQSRLSEELQRLQGWDGDVTSISKSYSFPTFMAGIEFVREVAELAEQANHHPDIDIRWKTVRIMLATHSEGGVTEKDIDLAHKIEDASARYL